MIFVSLGAIASIPADEISLSSNSGRQLTPLFPDFHTPPAAVATKTVLDGLGMPCTSERRPMKFDGPTFRQRKPLTTAVSRVCAASGAAPNSVSAIKRRMVIRLAPERVFPTVV